MTCLLPHWSILLFAFRNQKKVATQSLSQDSFNFLAVPKNLPAIDIGSISGISRTYEIKWEASNPVVTLNIGNPAEKTYTGLVISGRTSFKIVISNFHLILSILRIFV